MITKNLHIGEVELIQTQYNGELGDFKSHLWAAIMAADQGNLDRIEKGYPDQVRAYRDYVGKAGYWVDLLTRAGLVASPPEDLSVPPKKGAH